MSNNTPDYKEDLVFEPDYSIYQTARKLKKLIKERNLYMKIDSLNNLEFRYFYITTKRRTIRSKDHLDVIAEARSNKHLLEIIEVLTRG